MKCGGGYERFNNVPDSIDQYLYKTMVFEPHELGLSQFPISYLKDVILNEAGAFPLDNVMRLEVSNRLRNYHLARVDKITMGFGLEARCPFLDVNVVNVGLKMPSHLKRLNGKPKGILYEAFKDILPQWLIDRPKQPFSMPIYFLMSDFLYSYAHDTLTSQSAFVKDFIDPKFYLNKIKRNSESPEKISSKIWSLLQLEVWYQTAGKAFGGGV